MMIHQRLSAWERNHLAVGKSPVGLSFILEDRRNVEADILQAL
jgi:O-acetylhomoserine/O-acetylserine sulfhydrylase-like pyridoxal-dependent enzyme